MARVMHSYLLLIWTLIIVLYKVSGRHIAEGQDINSIETFEVVVPSLTTKGGHPIQESLHPHLHKDGTGRQRRSIPNEDNEELELNLALSTSSLHLQLHRLSGLVAANARTEWLRGNQTEATPLMTGCLYQGNIDGSPTSVGVFSLCDGITGTIVTSSEDIYLRPSPTGSGMNRPHVIYHHPHKTRSPQKYQDVHKHRHDRPRGRTHTERRRKEGQPESRLQGHRDKRSLKDLYRQGPKYIEVLLATDYTVVEFHGSDLVEQYLLTIMSIVDKIYHHPSLGVTFNVVVVRMLVLEDDVADDLFVKGSAKRTLDRFCAWTYANQPPKFPYEDQHDVAVYVTRRDIGPAGYAPVTGMCNSVRSCTIAKDDGISSAFVIAHEMGHVFGMHHDGDGNDCDSDPADGKIMSSMVQAAYDRFYWTNCSIDRLNMYIDDYHCLDNKPIEPSWPTYSEPFGQSWNLDEQCGQEFGKSYRLCQAFDNLDPCEYLWCSEKETPLLCKTKRGPPLPGTPCAPGKWCMKDKCEWVSEEEKEQATWSKWSSWGDCSRSCETGIQFRYRSCRREASEDNCEGEEEEFRLCNQDPCPKPQDFRAEQCNWMNSKRIYKGKKHTWLPLENRDKSKLCKLTCISKETEDIVVTIRNAIDGTLCSYDIPHDLCITGKCQRVGCDGKLGSDLKEDRCGVCGGYGNTCKVIADRFTQHLLARGVYHKTITLPKGARNIIVEEPHDNHHFLALKHENSKGFILNGKKKRGNAKIFILHGAKFVYIPSRDGESLTAKGPITKDINVLVFNTAKKMAIVVDYEFTMPNDFEYTPEYLNNINTDLEPIKTTYVWMPNGWTECSKTCDEGETREVYECREESSQKVMEDGFCSLMEKPEVHATTCNPQPCQIQTPYRWESGDWQPCSASCGLQGQQSRHVSCISNFYGKDQPVDYRYCDLTKVPLYHRRCNSHPCPASWRKTEWSKCSVTCGSGSQTRMVFCDKPRDGNTYECPGEQPSDTRICEIKPCPDKVESTTIYTTNQKTTVPTGHEETEFTSHELMEKPQYKPTDSKESDPQGEKVGIDLVVDPGQKITPDYNPDQSLEYLAPEGGSGDDIDDSFEDSEDPYEILEIDYDIDSEDDLSFEESNVQAVTQKPTQVVTRRPTTTERPRKETPSLTRKPTTTALYSSTEAVTKNSPMSLTEMNKRYETTKIVDVTSRKSVVAENRPRHKKSNKPKKFTTNTPRVTENTIVHKTHRNKHGKEVTTPRAEIIRKRKFNAEKTTKATTQNTPVTEERDIRKNRKTAVPTTQETVIRGTKNSKIDKTTVTTTQTPVVTMVTKELTTNKKTYTVSEAPTVRTIDRKKAKTMVEENSVVKESPKKPLARPSLDRYCRADKSVFCRLATRSNCAIPAYRDLCCMACGRL